MDKYFQSKKTAKDTAFDLDFQRKIDEDLKNFKYEGDLSYRDDVSEYGLASATKSRRDPLNDSVSSSLDLRGQAWEEFMKANQERDQALKEIEKDLDLAKMANKNQFIEFDYVQMEEKPLKLNNEIIAQEKVEEIRQTVLQRPPEISQSQILHRERKNGNNGLVLNHAAKADNEVVFHEPESPKVNNEVVESRVPSFIDQENAEMALRLEKAARNREIMLMEKEDQLSLDYERLMQKEKFKDRLFCLPETFPTKKEAPARFGSIEIPHLRQKFTMPVIPKPISNPKEHLLETSKTEIDKMLLNKIMNKKKPKLTYQKINEKDKVLLSKNKFDTSIATSKSTLLSKEENKSLATLKKLPSKENQVPQKLGEKVNRLSDSFEKSTKISSLSRWILNKALALYPKLAKIDQTAVKSALKEITNYPLDKVFYNETGSGILDKAPFNELDDNLDNTQKSLEYFISKIQQKSIRKLEVKMEDLIDIKNIGQLKSLQLLTLPMNKIQEVRELSTLKSLVEVDLSQNNIKSMKGLSNLKYLRQLNLEVNQITKIEDLEGCDLLEVLNLNNNQISRIEGLQTLKRLKKLYLFRNKITKMDGIENALWLEELDLGRNQIKEINGIQKLPALRKLVLYFNQIEKLPQNFSHISLSEIWLNGNKLVDICDLAYLPSLKFLNLQENEITTLTNNTLMFIPSLKTLNLSFNKIGSFGEVYRLIVHFGSLQQIDLGENLFFRGTTETLRAFYESILVTLLPNLTELNSKRITERNVLQIAPSKAAGNSLFLHSGRLENDVYYIDRFTSSTLNRYKGVYYTQSRQILANVNIGLFYLSKIMETSNLAQGETYILDHKYSYEIHSSAHKYKESMQKIKSFLMKILYKNRMRKKHFLKNLNKIVKIQAFWRGYCVRKVGQFRKVRLAKYAIKIQRCYRIFRARQKLKRQLKGIKFDDDEEFEEVSVDFKEPTDDAFQLNLPKGFSIEQFVTSASIGMNPYQGNVNYNQNLNVLQPVGSHKKQQNVIYEQEDNKEDDDDMSVSATSSKGMQNIRLKPTKPNAPKPDLVNKQRELKEKREEIKKDWGFEDENSMKIFEMRMKQKTKTKKKELTAEERLAKFKRS